jgi:hypothetical protein
LPVLLPLLPLDPLPLEPLPLAVPLLPLLLLPAKLVACPLLLLSPFWNRQRPATQLKPSQQSVDTAQLCPLD